MRVYNGLVVVMAMPLCTCTAGSSLDEPENSAEQSLDTNGWVDAEGRSCEVAAPTSATANTCEGAMSIADLDHNAASYPKANVLGSCADGQNYCSGGNCYACCNGQYYYINQCIWGVYFSCNGVLYNATNCWPCCGPEGR